MRNMKTGFSQIDETIGGLERGNLYFISALNREISRGFASSLCASINRLGIHNAVFITDSPIPFCRCEHIHFANTDELIEFLRVDATANKTHELPNTDIYFLEDFDLLSVASFDTWPCDRHLRKHLYESYLDTIKNLAKEFQITVVLTDQLYENNNNSTGLNCDFPDVRHKRSEGTFHLSEQERELLSVNFINHRTFDSFSFRLKSKPQKITQTYPAYMEE